MKDKFLMVIKHYGSLKQLKHFQTEVFELSEAIINYELKDSVDYEIPLTEILGSKEHLAEEVADCLNFINQFIEYYELDKEQIYAIMEGKMDRQLKRIADE